ncbi:unnamed protein product, partial [Darwinula stevensoni]
GAGTAGSVVASRLSEDRAHSVLLLEAGSEGTGIGQVPAFQGILYDTPFDWKYRPQAQKFSCQGLEEKVCKWIRGKILGGTSILSGGFYVRGNRRDYDNWAAMGNEGWDYDSVLPYFKLHEDNLDGDLTTGEIFSRTSPHTVIHIEHQAYLGFAEVQVMMTQNGRRQSAADAFVRPVLHRKNLHVSLNSHVLKVLIDRRTKTATGVKFIDKLGQQRTIRARREVILSAGTIATPQLLMLSGVGPKEELARHDIPLIADLPVGENLHGHTGVYGLTWTVRDFSGFNFFRDIAFNPLEFLRWFISGKEYNTKRTSLTLDEAALEARISSCPRLKNASNRCTKNKAFNRLLSAVYASEKLQQRGIPIESLCHNFAYYNCFEHQTGKNRSAQIYRIFKPLTFRDGFTIVPNLLRPRSRGRVTLRSADPLDQPRIITNVFRDPVDVALTVQGECIKKALEIGNTEAYRRHGAQFFPYSLPDCRDRGVFSDQYWECHARYLTFNLFHDVGTAKMGPADDPTAVVDPQLRRQWKLQDRFGFIWCVSTG